MTKEVKLTDEIDWEQIIAKLRKMSEQEFTPRPFLVSRKVWEQLLEYTKKNEKRKCSKCNNLLSEDDTGSKCNSCLSEKCL